MDRNSAQRGIITMFRDRSLTLLLTYAGALPFWFTVAAMFAGVLQVETGLRIFLAYGMVIAAFMAGTIWTAAHWSENRSAWLLMASNGVALAVFFAAALQMAPALILLVQAAGFLVLLGLDFAIYRSGDQPKWYLLLRARVTTIVILAYAVMGLALTLL